jgi:hypothetical protein
MDKLMTKIAAGVALIGVLALSAASASFAQNGDRHYYEPSNNESVWSYYPGYFDQEDNGRKAHASTVVPPRARARAAPHECWIPVFPQDQAPGMGYWGSCSEPGALPTK